MQGLHMSHCITFFAILHMTQPPRLPPLFSPPLSLFNMALFVDNMSKFSERINFAIENTYPTYSLCRYCLVYYVHISAFISLDMRSDIETNQFDCDILKYAHVYRRSSNLSLENFNYIIQIKLSCWVA